LKSKLDIYRAVANDFSKSTKVFPSVLEVAVFASVAGGDLYPTDVDLALFLSSFDDITQIAKIKRQLQSQTGGLDIFIFEQDRKFLGNLCSYRQCPAQSRDCNRPGCGTIPFIEKREGLVTDPLRWFRTPVDVLFYRLEQSILMGWQSELLKSLGRTEPEPYPIRETDFIRCWECGTRFEFNPGEQKHFEKMDFDPPKRCQKCRDARFSSENDDLELE
jgi:hypothetical protein